MKKLIRKRTDNDLEKERSELKTELKCKLKKLKQTKKKKIKYQRKRASFLNRQIYLFWLKIKPQVWLPIT